MYAIITGASRGIGKAIARTFALHGYNLLLASKTEGPLLATVEELKTDFPNISVDAQALDLGTKEGAQQFGQWVLTKADTIDIVVNNAGTFTPGTIAEEPEESLPHMMAVNLYSAYWLTKTLLPKLIAQRSGHVFTICSIAGLNAYPNGGAYSISKYALIGFTKNLRLELMPHGVKVTAIIPGAVYTDSWAGMIEPERIMEAEDIARMIWAASRLSPQAVPEEIVMRPQLGDL